MLITFNSITIHNFLSYGHAEIDLRNKHYCLVSGINNDPNDSATSNGAGKSTWSSAICWALTGQTIQGLTSNIKNINVDENSCYVILDFIVDNKHFIIERYKNPKSDLRITIDGKDVSGKGLRESEAVLQAELPDLTSQLIASIIILGQGLPSKFTDNTPSGRKEVLEKLSKSDFMIQDLKNRITSRSQTLNEKLRIIEDCILSSTSKKSLLEGQLANKQAELAELEKPKNFDSEIEALTEQTENIKLKLNEYQEKIQTLEVENSTYLDSFNKQMSEQTEALNNETDRFKIFETKYITDKTKLQSTISSVTATINQLKSITDICPTCGQKIAGIVKPDITPYQTEINEAQKQLQQLETEFQIQTTTNRNNRSLITAQYEDELNNIRKSMAKAKDQLSMYRMQVSTDNGKNTQLQVQLQKIIEAKHTYTESIQKAKNDIVSLTTTVQKLEEDILYNINRKQELSDHISVINQMNTLIKRDFRGYLLSGIIQYICKKAKEYSLDIFGTDKLDFYLNGNNIEITYCDKAFENLSGGEKQKVDLILQFAIRDMMKQYLGFSSNILILDEIFDQLDTEGCSNVLNLISLKLNDIESVYIISHRAGELEIPYDSELIVTKDQEGVSSVRWQ